MNALNIDNRNNIGDVLDNVKESVFEFGKKVYTPPQSDNSILSDVMGFSEITFKMFTLPLYGFTFIDKEDSVYRKIVDSAISIVGEVILKGATTLGAYAAIYQDIPPMVKNVLNQIPL